MTEYFPTRGGSYTAYEPEWLDPADGKWKRIPTRQSEHGVPQPIACGGINSELGLFGYEQAWAIAWQFAALAASQSIAPRIRVAQYEVSYDIKAKRCDLALEHAE